MQICWATFPNLKDETRDRIEFRLCRIAEGHGDRIDIQIVA
jgi:ribosome-associated translation inhibitor RaiA